MEKRQATIVVDLGFGDAGKGTMVDYLSRQKPAQAVIRFNGGGQAAHNVITPDGRHHTFSQFGSGTLAGTPTHLSRFMLVDPVALSHEADHLVELGVNDPFERLTIDASALVVTPFHKAANRLREGLRKNGQHGTCGMGIGETTADSLAGNESVLVKDLSDFSVLAKKLKAIQERKYTELQEYFNSIPKDSPLQEEIRLLSDRAYSLGFAESTVSFSGQLRIVPEEYLGTLANKANLLFEGAQGVLLDEWYGFHPHTTWSTTTFANAETLLREIGYKERIEKLGVLRAYHTRHGAGPFPTYSPVLSALLPDLHNGDAGWQGQFRVGWFDFILARYALSVCRGVDRLAITHLDRWGQLPEKKVCMEYAFQPGNITPGEQMLGEMKRGQYSLHVTALRKKVCLTDLEHQEHLTMLLKKAVPLYQPVADDTESFLKLIEAVLETPVGITSFGPTAADKYQTAFVTYGC